MRSCLICLLLLTQAHAEMRVYELRATGDATVTVPAATGRLWMRVGDQKWQVLPTPKAVAGAITVSVPAGGAAGEAVWLVSDKPAWLKLEDAGPPTITALTVDGQRREAAPTVDLGRGETPETVVVALADADNPLDPASVQVSLDGVQVDASLVKLTLGPGRKSGTITFSPAASLGAEQASLPRRHVIRIRADDYAIDAAASELTLIYTRQAETAADAVYLSDLPEVSTFVHSGLKKDTDYGGQPLYMGGVQYPKSLLTHVELAKNGNHSEVIYDLAQIMPPRQTLQALIGLGDEAGAGSVTFAVQVQTAPEGPWETRYQSRVLRGNEEPVGIKVDLSGARRLRLYCTDGGDGINCDHATWALARLE